LWGVLVVSEWYLNGKEKINSRACLQQARNDRGMGSYKSFLGEFIDYIIAYTLIIGSLTAETYMPSYTKDSMYY
jgi:hypothetical protein